MTRVTRIGCTVSSLFLVLLAVVRWGGWWRVDEVWVSPTRYVPAEQLTGILLGANVLRLQTGVVREQVARDPRVLAVKIRVRPLARRVEVEIKERERVVQVGLQSGAAVWVDPEGVILEPAPAPLVVGARSEGGRVSPEVVQAAHAVARLSLALRDSLRALDISDPTQVTATGEGFPTLLLGESSQLGDRLAILEALWERGLLAGYATVDLRVSDEVVLKRKR